MKRVHTNFTPAGLGALSLALLLGACGSGETVPAEEAAPAATSAAPDNAASVGPETADENSTTVGSASGDSGPAASTASVPVKAAMTPEEAAAFEPDEDHPVAGRPDITRKMLEDAVAKQREQQQ